MNALRQITAEEGRKPLSPTSAPAFDPAAWLAALEADGSEIHLQAGIAVVRKPGSVGFGYLSAHVGEVEDAGNYACRELRRYLGHIPQFVDYLRSIGRRDQLMLKVNEHLPDRMMRHAGERASSDIKAGDSLLVSSIPGLHGSAYYVWRWDCTVTGEEKVYLVGWINGRTRKGEPRRAPRVGNWGFYQERDAQGLYKVIQLGKPVL